MIRKRFEIDCVVIGGGPGGLISALYLSRFKRNVILIDAGHPRAQWIPRIRNLVGYAHGLTGVELLKRLRQQVGQYHVEMVHGKAHVKKIHGGFTVHVGSREIKTRKVILATGMTDVEPSIPHLEQLKKSGALGYCPVCDGFDHTHQKVGLLVRNVRGLHKAKFVHHFSPRIHVIQTKKFEIPPYYEGLFKKLNIRVHAGDLVSLELQTRPRRLIVKQKGKRPFDVDFAYVALGSTVNHDATKFMKGLKRTTEGFITVDYHQQTSIPGLYAVGDCVKALAQVSVAIGHAAVAATHVHNSLEYQ